MTASTDRALQNVRLMDNASTEYKTYGLRFGGVFSIWFTPNIFERRGCEGWDELALRTGITLYF